MRLINNRFFIIVFAIVLKLAISLPFIESFPIDLDEPFSIFHAQKSLPELMELFGSENNPPLHFILLHFWEKLFGINAFSVRTMSLLFSVLTIPLLYELSRKYVSQFGSILLLTLFIFSDFHHYHGLEARTYSLLILLFTMTFYILSKIILEKKFNYAHFVGLSLFNVLLFYTHYISIFIFIAEITLLITFFKKEYLKLYLVSISVFILTVGPWINTLMSRTGTITNHGTWLQQAQFTELYGLLNKFLNDKWSMMTLIICFVILLFYTRKTFVSIILNDRTRLFLLTSLAFIPYVLSFLFSRFGINLFYDRYLFFLTIPLFLLIIFVFDRFEVHGRLLLMIFAVGFVLRFDLEPNNNRDGNILAKYVHSLPHSPIVIAPEYYDLTFLYHYDRAIFSDYNSVEKHVVPSIHPFDQDVNLKEISRKNESLILVDANFQFTEPNNSLHNDLAVDYVEISSKEFKGGYLVSFWQRKINAEPTP